MNVKGTYKKEKHELLELVGALDKKAETQMLREEEIKWYQRAGLV